MSTPTLFCLHALGSSGGEFAALTAELGDTFDVVAIDLPGFGHASTATGTTIDEMVRHVIREIKQHPAGRWMIVGHSMGGKIATLVAKRTLDGTAGLFGLSGVVLLAASPPSPEPMTDESRAQSIAMAADGPVSAADARSFIDDNVGAPLDAAADARALDDVQHSDPEAWRAWFERGSREDHLAAVGTLDVPAAIVAGGADGDLGPDAQRRLNAPVYPRADVTVLDGAGHLLPYERPREVADVILRLWNDHAGRGPVVPDDVIRTIASARTSTKTRAILARRALADEPDHAPRSMTAEQLATFRAIADRVVPQGSGPEQPHPHDAIDIAARVDSQLAREHSDGWRNAALPPDPEAYRLALDVLADFASLTETEQDATIEALIDGSYEPGGDAALDAKQLSLWFEDCRVDLVRTWLAHPATMARVGFDGYANGGDLTRIQGFQRLGAGEREGWEPAMPAAPGAAAVPAAFTATQAATTAQPATTPQAATTAEAATTPQAATTAGETR
ncbi:hypothetical protein AX769_05380 [Frondihabitans sp. PAMC 28766]|uniref:alpha/beta hydrolase n=1 Tax=Frondihabitans sp. PAMC 28766 TaxID=1795630 RepID=UPI00078E61E7|nr:alpha/beta hydrolase [Frondihabitans sp. PAMC 28766]AMM19678.1 hypothetical protein AX769_05380 [Frondihabitans sp. PAMC 28766]